MDEEELKLPEINFIVHGKHKPPISVIRSGQWLRGNQRILDASRLLLEKLEATALGKATEVEFEWIVAVIGAPTYDPTDATLQALSKGLPQALS